MTVHAALSDWAGRLAVPDPAGPAATLDGLDPSALLGAADSSLASARALAACGNAVRQALSELTKGWSAPSPQMSLTRMGVVTEETALTLLSEGRAMESTATVMNRAQSNARLDWALAVAQLNSMSAHSWPEVVSGIFGVPQVGEAIQISRIIRELYDSLTNRIAEVEAAVNALQASLSVDPTAGPDGLRAGPAALLPPDPVRNPAHRTDVQNRAALATDLHSGDPARMKFAMSILQSLQVAADRGGVAQLVVYDSRAYRGQGRAAISVGDLTTANNVAVLVPGIANSPSDMSGGVGLAADLRDEANRQDAASTTAVVAWYGYDIPLSWTKDPSSSTATDITDTIAAGSAANASGGGSVLATDLSRIKAMSQSSVRTTLIGFSMGSTTVSEAARYQLPVESIVLLGSPGAGWDTTSASGYRNVRASDVFVLSYDQDPVTLPVTDQLASQELGIPDPYGPDPAAKSFGGNHIDAQTNVPLLAGGGLLVALSRILGDPRHHSMKNYMEGPALAAEGAIVIGRSDRVPTKPGRERR